MLRALGPAVPGLALHPLTETADLPISPVVAASLSVSVLIAVAFLWPAPDSAVGRERVEPGAGVRPIESWQGGLSRWQAATRALAVALLALATVAGRIGSTSELENIAPALVLGVAWPMLVLGSANLGPIWRWIDPWDGLARLFDRAEHAGSPEPGDVRPAVLFALLWVWYLSAYPESTAPRSVGLALAAYTIATLAGCIALGRAAWLSRGEAFGVFFGWIARLPRGRLADWAPPRGAEFLLGVIGGGLLYGLVRRSQLWGTLNVVPLARLYAVVGVIASAAVVSGLFWILERKAARRGARGSVAAAAVPAVAAIAVAVGMARDRLFTSLQLLPSLASDPFGRGWDLFGTADFGIRPNPLGDTGRTLAQVLVLVAGHLLGAVVLARRASSRARDPAAFGLTALLALAVMAVTVG